MLFKVQQDERKPDKNEDRNNMCTNENVKCGIFYTTNYTKKSTREKAVEVSID